MRPFIIPVFIPHLGCPHRCVFCNQQAITGVKTDLQNDLSIKAHIEQFLTYRRPYHSKAQIAFYGGNFLGLEKKHLSRLLTLAGQFIEAETVSEIRFSTRPDTVDDESLALIDPYPIAAIELGVQSMDNGVLEASRRGHSAAQTSQAATLIKRQKIPLGLQMMVGLPGDSRATAIRTAHQMAAMEPDFVRIYPTIVLAQSPLASWYERGRYTPLSLEAAVDLVKDLYTIFKGHDITVIRMGLQADDTLAKKNWVMAGPYHPAFGHLVHQALFLDRAVACLETSPPASKQIRLSVHPRSVAQMRGHRNGNLDLLERRFGIVACDVVADESLALDEVRISDHSGEPS